MKNNFKLLMIGAMYENGGNTTHRFLDGHPQLWVYPFESQLGTKGVSDPLTSMFPVKYRWPVFNLDASAYDDYQAILDEEGKVRAKTPSVSKFRHWPFEMSDEERCKIYQTLVAKSGRSRARNIAAFFEATFRAWKNYKRSGKEVFYVGYSPILVVDADKVLNDFPGANFLHIVRNPWSAYADTKKRAVPLSLRHYMLGWMTNQYYALYFRNRYPDRLHIIRTEDVWRDSYKTLGGLCEKLGLKKTDSLKTPSWNGTPLKEICPWGTIRKATPEANKDTALELSKKERDEIRALAGEYLSVFDYKRFV